MSKKLEETIELMLGDEEAPEERPASAPPLLSTLEKPSPSALIAENVVVPFATGAYLYPTYLDELIIPNLSLSEQVLFHRIYRISQKLSKTTEKMSVSALAESCSLSPELASSSLKSLVRKKVLQVIHKNPFTKKARYRLVLPKKIRKKLILCAVCHEMIREEDDWKKYPIAKLGGERIQYVVAHEDCLMGTPFAEVTSADESTLDSSAEH